MLLISLTLTATAAHAYHLWPNPKLDALEGLRFDLAGTAQLSSFINPCDTFAFGDDNTGRADAADWLRTVRSVSTFPVRANSTQAYHDMATHNVADGTGGLDASIRFETDRPEVGVA